MRTDQTNIKVAVRVRPYNSKELGQNQRCIIKVMDQKTLLFDPDDDEDEFFYQGCKQTFRDISKRVHKKLSMEYDRVYDTESTNKQIFEELTAPLVDTVLDGYNCSVFVYGATGAGKTFTMLGNEACAGLTYLTMRDLFEKIDAQSELRKFNIAVSYLEVYNEQVMNLLTKTGPLKLREDGGGVVVSGLVPKPIFSAEELLELLSLGNSHRTQHPTDANAESSRSHAVFQVHIRITDRKTDTKRTVKLSMIDLAGSERAASTKGIGLRFREGANINKSLLALGNCINKLSEGLKHVPYRDSNLTRILKDSLGGNCQTLMVANVSMSSLTFEDTYNTLKYASRAKKIRTTLRQNALKTNMPKEFYIKKVDELMTENLRCKEINKTLEAKLALLQNASALPSTSRTYDEIELKNWYRKIDAVYSSVIKDQEYVLGLQSKIKITKYALRMREYYENYCQILTLNRPLLQEEMDNFHSKLNRIHKQMEKHSQEQIQWRKKLADSVKDIEKLKKEIKSSKYADILGVYQKSKDLEIQYCKQNIKNNHISDVNAELVNETKKLRQSFTHACGAIQRYYEEYGSGGVDLKNTLDDLKCMMHANMTVIEISDNSTLSASKKQSTSDSSDSEEVQILVNGKRALPREYESNDSAVSTAKKSKQFLHHLDFDHDLGLALSTIDDEESGVFHLTHADEGESVFKIPKSKMSRNLNETHVLLPTSSNDWNKTFELSTDSSSTMMMSTTPEKMQKMQQKKAYVSNILSEQIVATASQNKNSMKNALLKSNNFDHNGILKTVSMALQKENKKYSPNRIRKSPRSTTAKPFGTSTHLLKKPSVTSAVPTRKFTTRNEPSTQAPIVRINRAASFRVKK